MNLFGFDVQALDVPVLVASGQALWWVLGLAAVAFLIRRSADPSLDRSSRIVLGLALAGHAVAWFVTMFPLPSVYGTNASMDRENHLGWAQVIVAGNSPIRSSQVNQLSFEPLWPNLVALASLYRSDLVGLVFQFSPMLIGFLFALSVYFCVSRGLGDPTASKTEAAFAAFFALLLASASSDQTAPFRNPWALTFLLKPNHALGLVLFPFVLLALARANTWKERLWTGFLLQVLGWAFVIHMAFVISGFVLFVFLGYLTRSEDRAKNTLDVAVAIGVNLIIVSPYLLVLVDAFGSLSPSPRFGISPQSAHTLDGTVRLGPVFAMAMFGAWSLFRGASRFGRILSAQFAAAHVNWQIYNALGALHLGREMDEAYYWVRFMTALVAGIGCWRMAGLASLHLRHFIRLAWLKERVASPALMAAALLAVAVPSALPAWWDPLTMDRYFGASRRPMPDRVLGPTRFLRENTEGAAVVAGDRVYARYVAAFGSRRVLLAESLNPPRDTARRAEIESAIALGAPASLIEEGRRRYGVRYFLVTPAFIAGYPGITLETLLAREDLRQVFDFGSGVERIVIFELLPSRS